MHIFLGGRANDALTLTSFPPECQQLMEYWREALPMPMLEVEYEAIVANLERESRRLVAWCGLEWNPACLEFHKTRRAVQTVSAAQVRRPIYQSSIGRWRNYTERLCALFANLERGDPGISPR